MPPRPPYIPFDPEWDALLTQIHDASTRHTNPSTSAHHSWIHAIDTTATAVCASIISMQSPQPANSTPFSTPVNINSEPLPVIDTALLRNLYSLCTRLGLCTHQDRETLRMLWDVELDYLRANAVHQEAVRKYLDSKAAYIVCTNEIHRLQGVLAVLMHEAKLKLDGLGRDTVMRKYNGLVEHKNEVERQRGQGEGLFRYDRRRMLEAELKRRVVSRIYSEGKLVFLGYQGEKIREWVRRLRERYDIQPVAPQPLGGVKDPAVEEFSRLVRKFLRDGPRAEKREEEALLTSPRKMTGRELELTKSVFRDARERKAFEETGECVIV